MAKNDENLKVSQDERAVYDRQIRLWGIEAQNKLRNAKVLIIGGTQLGAEVAKTLSLAGVDQMHLVDHRLVEPHEVGTNFLYNGDVDNSKLTKWAAGYDFLYNLNRNVKLTVDEQDIFTKSDDELEQFVQRFTIVVLIDENYNRVVRLNEICHKNRVRFIAGAVFGWIGYGFFDFDGHSFQTKVQDTGPTTDVESQNGAKKTTIDLENEDRYEQKTFSYPTFVEAFNSDFSSKKAARKAKRSVPSSYFVLKSLLTASREQLLSGDVTQDVELLADIWKQEVIAGNQTIESQTVQPEKFDHLFPPEFAPTSACVGGLIGQEAIKTISEATLPIRNIFIYSALDATGAACDFPLA